MISTTITLKYYLKICWKDLYSGYLFLDNKPPQNLVAQNNHYFVMLTHSVGREFRKGTEEMACLCSTMSGASDGKTCRAEDDSKGWHWNNWVTRNPLSIRWLIHPHINQAHLGLMIGTPLCGLSMWLFTARWLNSEREQIEGVILECEQPGSVTSTILCCLRCSQSHSIQGKGIQILTTRWEVMREELKNL